MFSFGFQQAYHRGFAPGDEIFFTKVTCMCLRLPCSPVNDRLVFRGCESSDQEFHRGSGTQRLHALLGRWYARPHFAIAVPHLCRCRSFRLLILCLSLSPEGLFFLIVIKHKLTFLVASSARILKPHEQGT